MKKKPQNSYNDLTKYNNKSECDQCKRNEMNVFDVRQNGDQ